MLVLGVQVYNYIGYENNLNSIKEMLEYDKFYKLKVLSNTESKRFKYISTLMYGSSMVTIFAKLNLDNTITLIFQNEKKSNTRITTTIYPLGYEYFLTHFEVEKKIN